MRDPGAGVKSRVGQPTLHFYTCGLFLDGYREDSRIFETCKDE